MRWKPFEEDLLRDFLLSHKQNLILNMYKNILAGELRFRRETKLFHEMSKVVGRTSLQCKSKMQKFEKHAYTMFLGIKPSHYEIFEWLRKRRSIKMRRRRRGRKARPHEDDTLMEQKRTEVVREVLQGKVILEGKFCCASNVQESIWNLFGMS
jgi:hypothetical protein